jgi:hypothetical protein
MPLREVSQRCHFAGAGAIAAPHEKSVPAQSLSVRILHCRTAHATRYRHAPSVNAPFLRRDLDQDRVGPATLVN